MRSLACTIHPLSVEEFLLMKIVPTLTFVRPVTKMYLNTAKAFSGKTAEDKGILSLCAKARIQHIDHEAKEHISQREEVGSPVQAADTSPLPSTPRDSRQLGKRASTRPSTLDL